jgi:hypothetical protein
MRLNVNVDRGNVVYIGGIVRRNREVLGSRAQDWVMLVSTRWGTRNLNDTVIIKRLLLFVPVDRVLVVGKIHFVGNRGGVRQYCSGADWKFLA